MQLTFSLRNYLVITRDENGRVSFGRFDHVIQFLIIVSLVDFAFETLPDLSPRSRQILHGIEVFTIIVFTIEWILRAVLSRPSKSYIFSFFGFIDLIAVLPFYVTSGIDLRSVRALRLLRLLKLARYSKAMQRYHRAFLIAKEELILFGFTALILFYLASVGIYYFEHEAQPEAFKSVFHSFWWATTTLTTVGYGDAYPITIGGKIFTFFVLMIGLGFVAVPTGLFASALSTARKEEGEQGGDGDAEEAV